MKTKFMLATAVLLAAYLAPAAALAQRRGAQPFTQVKFLPGSIIGSNMAGQVGHHFSIAGFHAFEDDLPAGNARYPASDTCLMSVVYLSHSGDLPPGIVLTPYGGPFFAGTPRQPGTWHITLSVEVGCTGGPDQARYQRTIDASFTIQP